MTAGPSHTTEDRRRLLNVIAVVAVSDFVLLVPLVLGFVGVLNTESFVAVIGMMHGVGFVGLVAMTGIGARRRWWGWWFPILTLVSGGAVGSVIGDLVIRRSLGVSAQRGESATSIRMDETRAPTMTDTTS